MFNCTPKGQKMQKILPIFLTNILFDSMIYLLNFICLCTPMSLNEIKNLAVDENTQYDAIEKAAMKAVELKDVIENTQELIGELNK